MSFYKITDFLICRESWPRYCNLVEGKKSLKRIPFSSTSSLRRKIQIENMALGSNGVGAIKDSEAPGVSGVKNTSKSGQYQLPDRRMIAEASLDKKLTFLWDACQNIRKKEKDSEKAILDLGSEIESLKADTTKLLAKIKNANIRSASLDGVLKAMEDKEASVLTSQTSERENIEETVRVLEKQIAWVKRELLLFKKDDQYLMELKTYLLRTINSKEVEDCKLSLDEDGESEEIKTLKEKENEMQKTPIRLQTEIEQVLGVLVVTQHENKKIEQIINFLKENNEVMNTVSLVRRSAEINNCSRDREQVKIMVETLDQELSELESVIEAGFLQFSQICESFGS